MVSLLLMSYRNSNQELSPKPKAHQSPIPYLPLPPPPIVRGNLTLRVRRLFLYSSQRPHYNPTSNSSPSSLRTKSFPSSSPYLDSIQLSQSSSRLSIACYSRYESLVCMTLGLYFRRSTLSGLFHHHVSTMLIINLLCNLEIRALG
ncbi:unnamed protein product [Rhodiola kirilowii]